VDLRTKHKEALMRASEHGEAASSAAALLMEKVKASSLLAEK